MSGQGCVNAVKNKIKVLREQADVAAERAEKLQKEVEKERKAREEVLFFSFLSSRCWWRVWEQECWLCWCVCLQAVSCLSFVV